MTVDQIVEDILRREGGYVYNKADRGGPTNWGITQKTYSEWLGHPVTIDEVKALSRETAKEIYLTNYYHAPRINALPEEIQPQLFDIAVNSGPKTALKLLQKVLNLADFACSIDGKCGPQTAKLSRQAQQEMGPYLTNAISEAREEFYRHIVDVDPSQKVFLNGWINRAQEFRVEVQ